MANLLTITSKRIIRPGERLFEPINDFTILLAAICKSLSLATGNGGQFSPTSTARVNASGARCAFAIPLYGPFELAVAEQAPASIEIGHTPLAADSPPIEGPTSYTTGLQKMYVHVISPIFLAFFERYNVWLTSNLGDAAHWPMVLNFARLVRNAAAHGQIEIRNPTTPPVVWHGFSYSSADHGKQIIGNDLSMGEILALMFDVSDELDAINAPTL